MAIDELAALMVRQLTEAMEQEAGAPLRLVSITLDVTGPMGEDAPRFETGLDRRTRTLVFCNGRAMYDAGLVMTATAVFALESRP